MINSFEAFSAQFKPILEAHLLESVTFQIQDPRKILEEAMTYSLMAPAKRIRPLIVLATFLMVDSAYTKILPYASAIEMLHTYSLIHDDLPAMDNDDYRRGRLTCHKKFREDVAILAGDTLNTLAFELIAKDTHYEPSAVLQALHLLASSCGIYGMAGGQVLDLLGPQDSSAMALKRIHALKTGAMLQASVMVPVMLTQLDPETRAHLHLFSTHLGLLFQIVDDILDVEGDPQLLGKTVGKDETQNKLTYVQFYGLEKAKLLAREESQNAKDALLKVTRYNTHLLEEILEYIGTRNL